MSLSSAEIDDHTRPGPSRPEIATINTGIVPVFPIASELLICLKHEFSRVSQVLLSERQRRLK